LTEKQGCGRITLDQNMKLFLDITQIVIAILLVVSILLQQKGDGLGSAFGGGGENIATTRRGAEKGVFTLSIILSVLFIGLAVARMFI